MDPGFYYGLEASLYHSDEALGSHGALKLLQSPQHFQLSVTTPTAPTAAMLFGTAVHLAVLEPERFAWEVVPIPPMPDRRTKEGKMCWIEFTAQNEGKIALTAEDYARVLACRDAVNAHPRAARMLSGACTEVSAFWLDAEFKVPCKGRYDVLNGGIADLKTCRDASPEGFARDAANFGYHAQGAHYWSGHEHVTDKSPDYYGFIAVEVDPPHAVGCYYLPPVAIQAGRRMMDRALARFYEARRTGVWAGYSDKILPLELPRWALRDTYHAE